MTPNMLRQLWSLVESSQPSHLLELDDGSLTNWLISQMDNINQSSASEVSEKTILESYIRDHLLLIRDIADDTWQSQNHSAILAY